ncbi:MAG: serine hydrolase, partial [Bacteroidetes bacterium]|nr:serine hydrolase [Bacteroidota bacterium]
MLKLVKVKWNVPGLAVGIVKDGEIIFKKGYGYRNLENQLPVTTETLFSTGSSTKSFTATGIGLLVDNEKLSWNDRVQEYLPEFALKDSLWGDQATITDILSHRTGLPAHNMMQFAICDQYGREEIVKRIQYLDLSEEFRTEPQYQNQMYQVATVLIENVSGQTWEEFTRESIFEPLNMDHTTFHGSSGYLNTGNITTRYEYTSDGEYVPARPLGSMMREISGSGSIFSTIDDMSRWLLFNINKGSFKDSILVSKESMETILDPHIPISKKIGDSILLHSFALGWDMLAYRGHLLYDKPGGYMGVTSQVVFLPDEEVGLVLFANLRSQMAYWIITLEILDRVLGLEPISYIDDHWAEEQNYINRIVENLQPLTKPEKSIKPLISTDNFVGKYQNDGYGNISVY